MKKLLLLALLPGLLLSSAPIRISKASPIEIVIPENPAPDVKNGAAELKDYFLKITGADCAIVTEGAEKTPAIYVGPTTFAKKSVKNYTTLQREEWVIKTTGANLILCGGEPRGTIYAVYEFLESIGVVWADVLTEYWPTMNEIVVADRDVREKPAFMSRVIYSGIWNNSDQVVHFLSRNKMNNSFTSKPEYGGNDRYGSPGFCHTYHLYSQKDWPDEWFSLDKNGKRLRSTSTAGPGQLCPSHPDLQKAMAKRLREFIEKDRKDKSPDKWPIIYIITHNDNNTKCLCDACCELSAKEETDMAPKLALVNYCANDIAKDYPEILVQTAAYAWTVKPPKTMRPAPNVMIEMNKIGLGSYNKNSTCDVLLPDRHPYNKEYYDDFLGWEKISSHLSLWDYWIAYGWDYQPPYLIAHTIQEDTQFHKEMNVKTAFIECEDAANTSFAEFKWWFGMKMLQNPYLDYDKLADSFCRAEYGPAAAPMKKYMEYLQERKRSNEFVAGRVQKAKNCFLMPDELMRNVDYPLPYLDRDFYETANALLDEAEKLAANDARRLSNVRKERLPVDLSLLNTFGRFGDNPPVGSLIPKTKKALFERYAEVYLANIKRYYVDAPFAINKKKYDAAIKSVESNRKRLDNPRLGIPAEFDGRTAVTILASNIKNIGKGMAENDPDAFGGWTRRLPDSYEPNYHRLPFTMGGSIHGEPIDYPPRRLKQEEIAQDGKYHLYKIGRYDIIPRSYLYLHWTWRLQCEFDFLHVPGGDNKWDVYASLKFEGEPYVKGSVKKPAVFLDRIILVK